jgi:hypothetical protein
VSHPCTVLIASAETLPALKERASRGEGELIAFTDADALKALEAITARKPALVALERVFAGTPRGTALINRIKADPSLKQAEIRVVSPDAEFPRVARPAAAPIAGGPASTAAAVAHAPAKTQPLDQKGTRRAQRVKIAKHLDILVDGSPAKLIDISTVGAQVISSAVLKPNQRLRVGLTDDHGDVRVRASVAWASFEISPAGPRYRAGIQFLDADPGAINSFISRHK